MQFNLLFKFVLFRPTNLPGGFQMAQKKNNKSDMILYLQAFAALLEEKLTEYTNISDVLQASAKQAYSIY